jgi:hypothetical protein
MKNNYIAPESQYKYISGENNERSECYSEHVDKYDIMEDDIRGITIERTRNFFQKVLLEFMLILMISISKTIK